MIYIRRKMRNSDQEFGTATGADRGCGDRWMPPATAIREDCSMNLEAVDEMAEKFPDVQIIFIESGGDNLSATFSPDLADVSIICH